MAGPPDALDNMSLAVRAVSSAEVNRKWLPSGAQRAWSGCVLDSFGSPAMTREKPFVPTSRMEKPPERLLLTRKWSPEGAQSGHHETPPPASTVCTAPVASATSTTSHSKVPILSAMRLPSGEMDAEKTVSGVV